MVQNEKFVTCFEGVNVAEVNYFQQWAVHFVSLCFCKVQSWCQWVTVEYKQGLKATQKSYDRDSDARCIKYKWDVLGGCSGIELHLQKRRATIPCNPLPLCPHSQNHSDRHHRMSHLYPCRASLHLASDDLLNLTPDHLIYCIFKVVIFECVHISVGCPLGLQVWTLVILGIPYFIGNGLWRAIMV